METLEFRQIDIYEIINKKHNCKVLYKGNTTDQGEWLEHRVIGASAIHNLVEADRYREGLIEKPEYSSPWILFQELKGLYKPVFSPAMQDKLDFGHFAEDFIRGKFKEKAEQQGIEGVISVVPGDEVLGIEEVEYATCTPDGWVNMSNGDWIPMECKTGDSFQWKDWSGETVPDKYYSQCQWILAITNKPFMFILGWIDNKFTKVFTVKKDQVFIDYMFGLAENFWKDFKENIEPEMVGNKVEADALGVLYEIPRKEKAEAQTSLDDESIEILTTAMQELKEIEKANKPTLETFKVKIKKEMLEKGVQILRVGNLTAKLNARGALSVA